MGTLLRTPLLVFVASFVAMWLSAQIGGYFRRRTNIDEKAQEDRDMVVTATLTLLGLIIGFSFSMAIARYDQRKNYEEAEANAIGTEWVRAELLPASDAANVKKLLTEYLKERIEFYEAGRWSELQQINQRTGELQTQLWMAVNAPVKADPTPVAALIVSGMNDVLNSQGYTQAAWWNRIPTGAWILMVVIAICSNFLVGYGTHSTSNGFMRYVVLPIILSVAFFMIADIDSPRRGVIRVVPQNLIALMESLKGP